MSTYAERILQAQQRAGLSQRKLAEVSGISQSTLSRIISDTREPTSAELLQISTATGTPFAVLSEIEQASDRALFAARSTSGASMNEMKEALSYYLNLSAYLDDQAIV